ncbi:MAG: zinc ribbon domain-containing protein [Candidatus Bathyarchaeia archaeon]
MTHPTAPFLIAILLLSSALTIAVPEASSQQLTTQYETVTTHQLATITNYGTTTVSSVATLTGICCGIGQAGNTPQTYTVTLTPPPSQDCGTVTPIPIVYGTPYENVTISFISTKNIDFFVFPSISDYFSWEKNVGCNFKAASNATVKEHNVNSYSVEIRLTPYDAASPVLAFLYTSHGESSNAEITVTETDVYPIGSMLTQIITNVHTMEITATAILSSELMIQPQYNNNTPQLALTLAVIAAAIIGAAFLYTRRRGQPTVTEAEKVELKTEKPTTTKKNFCIECGSELPLKSKFCNNCGSKQPDPASV